MAGQILGYVRVSSTDQDPARQVEAIGAVEETFTDHVSGGSCETRTALDTMLRRARRGDTVRVASTDRLARSVVDLAGIVTEPTGRGVRGAGGVRRRAAVLRPGRGRGGRGRQRCDGVALEWWCGGGGPP